MSHPPGTAAPRFWHASQITDRQAFYSFIPYSAVSEGCDSGPDEERVGGGEDGCELGEVGTRPVGHVPPLTKSNHEQPADRHVDQQACYSRSATLNLSPRSVRRASA